MIPVQGFEGQAVAVLGLGRSGLATVRALLAGGATVVAWDDGPHASDIAEAEGIILRDLTKPNAFEDIACLVTSPGIPHLYPQPHPAIAAALLAGVPVDNDIGLFFRLTGTVSTSCPASSRSPDRTANPPPRR
jgi:UDP-N-acetylmuramoylalanine--D-glutamate ligase